MNRMHIELSVESGCIGVFEVYVFDINIEGGT
jgi:hypothetical protein